MFNAAGDLLIGREAEQQYWPPFRQATEGRGFIGRPNAMLQEFQVTGEEWRYGMVGGGGGGGERGVQPVNDRFSIN